MAYGFKQGFFQPLNPKKYKGNSRNIAYRSGWELKVMVWLDRNPNIIEWSSEEVVVPYRNPFDNTIHRYFPDFLVKMNTINGIETFLIEVKPESQIQPPKPPKNKNKLTKAYIQASQMHIINQTKWEYAKAYCKSRGYKFTTLNEYDIGIAKR
jgi:hypothetical protein